MTIAFPLFRLRRVLAICVASAVLHYLAIGWVGVRMAALAARSGSGEPAPIVAELRAAPVPLPMPAAPRPARQRPAAPPPVPALQPQPEPAPAPPAAAPAPEPAETGAVPAPPQVESDAAPQEAAPAPPRYQVSLPPSAELYMDVARTDAKGVSWAGQSVIGWRHGGGAYSMSLVASITILVEIKLVELASEGAIGDDGIVPRSMTEKRRNRARTATHFDAQQGRISFSASANSHPMLPGAQDKATFPMQLAGIARADPAQLAAGVEMLVGEDKEANLYRFVVVGQEEIETRLGKLATWRLARPPLPGSYNSRLDVWLAPGHQWYPVQLRSSEANGAVTTQTISKIVIKEAGN